MTKRIISLLAAFAVLLALSACTPEQAPDPRNVNVQQAPAQSYSVPQTDAAVPSTTASTDSSQAPSSASKQQTSTAYISGDKAISIALEHAGVKRADVRDLEAELDRDNGVTHYEVDFEYNRTDYSYEIHATSGKILRSEKEKDD